MVADLVQGLLAKSKNGRNRIRTKPKYISDDIHELTEIHHAENIC